MLYNYLKITLRNILKHKGYSFINISGLAIGMTCCLLISLWVLDELSYDKFHLNASHLYRVEANQHYSGSVFHVWVTPHGMAPAMVLTLIIALLSVAYQALRASHANPVQSLRYE